MSDLPIRRLVIYKHGVGYFERRGPLSGEVLRLSFPREAMDDVLKSLVVLDFGSGHVLGIDFETPEDHAARLASRSIQLSDTSSLLDLLRDLRGRAVRVQFVRQGQATEVEGIVVGVDIDQDEPLVSPLCSIYQPEQRRVWSGAVRDLRELTILDQRAAEDLSFVLHASQSQETQREAMVRLSAGDHDLLVGYVAPAPAWRVSYRLLASASATEVTDQAALGADDEILLQGWGLFDNQLDEDLSEVELTLVAGMPVSFRYRLYEPHTPERPLVADEERTVNAPIMFDAMLPAAAPMMMAEEAAAYGSPPSPKAAGRRMMNRAVESTPVASVGEERGALFQYRVAHPVSVARGQSAMVPVVGQRLYGRRELLYNSSKQERHPVASLRLTNTTGLTLERGPVTVIVDDDYAGEGIVPFTRAGGELIVAYAVELGITISESHHTENALHSLQVRDDYLLVQEWSVQRTLYRITSTLATTVTVVIEQQIAVGYELTETSVPAEQAHGEARWPVACPPSQETIFMVRQRRLVSRHEKVRNLTLDHLRRYMRQRLLDDATYNELSAILDRYARIAASEQRLADLKQEREQIYKRQQQTKNTIQPLGRDGDEGALRSRYITLLGELENQLEGLDTEEQQIQSQITHLHEEIQQALAALATTE